MIVYNCSFLENLHFINLFSDVMMWLDSRKFTKKDQLREVDVYVVIDDELEKEYDEFNRDYTDSIIIHT